MDQKLGDEKVLKEEILFEEISNPEHLKKGFKVPLLSLTECGQTINVGN